MRRTTTAISAALLLLSSVCAPRAAGLLPPLPWTFPGARVLYQPTLVPLPAARAATPPDLRILSLFGWTLGGAFVVDWPASPVGPYREVAVLSALVVRDFGIGAWASHIVVTAPAAAAAARELFGLPAVVGTVDLIGADRCPASATQDDAEEWARAWGEATGGLRRLLEDTAAVLKYTLGTAGAGLSEPAERLRPPTTAAGRSRRLIFRDSASVEVNGWDGWRECPHHPARGDSSGGDVALNLPSFSGRLAREGDGPEGGRTSLLRYDLRLGPAHGVRLRPPMPTEVRLRERRPLLEGVLGGSAGLIPCIQVDGVRIVAGQPEEIDAQ